MQISAGKMLRGFTSLKYPEKSRQVMKLWLHEKEWEQKTSSGGRATAEPGSGLLEKEKEDSGFGK